MYGFGLIREMELHQEAGFQTLKIIQHATGEQRENPRPGRKMGRCGPATSPT